MASFKRFTRPQRDVVAKNIHTTTQPDLYKAPPLRIYTVNLRGGTVIEREADPEVVHTVWQHQPLVPKPDFNVLFWRLEGGCGCGLNLSCGCCLDGRLITFGVGGQRHQRHGYKKPAQ
jgi:hypothetical protein